MKIYIVNVGVSRKHCLALSKKIIDISKRNIDQLEAHRTSRRCRLLFQVRAQLAC